MVVNIWEIKKFGWLLKASSNSVWWPSFDCSTKVFFEPKINCLAHASSQIKGIERSFFLMQFQISAAPSSEVLFSDSPWNWPRMVVRKLILQICIGWKLFIFFKWWCDWNIRCELWLYCYLQSVSVRKACAAGCLGLEQIGTSYLSKVFFAVHDSLWSIWTIAHLL